MKQRLILASASPRRRQLMEQIGLEAEVIPSRAEETVEGCDPAQVVENLSRKKAEEVHGRFPDAVVIGADTVVAAEGRILGKPAGPGEAEEILGLLQGKVHQVYTGVTIICGRTPEKTRTFSEKTDVEVYPMSPQEIRRYVASGDPMDKAGAYGIQGPFAAFIRGIAGDYNNVVGLPVGRLYQELKALVCLSGEDEGGSKMCEEEEADD